jgi:hypothetical protein
LTSMMKGTQMAMGMGQQMSQSPCMSGGDWEKIEISQYFRKMLLVSPLIAQEFHSALSHIVLTWRRDCDRNWILLEANRFCWFWCMTDKIIFYGNNRRPWLRHTLIAQILWKSCERVSDEVSFYFLLENSFAIFNPFCFQRCLLLFKLLRNTFPIHIRKRQHTSSSRVSITSQPCLQKFQHSRGPWVNFMGYITFSHHFDIKVLLKKRDNWNYWETVWHFQPFWETLKSSSSYYLRSIHIVVLLILYSFVTQVVSPIRLSYG